MQCATSLNAARLSQARSHSHSILHLALPIYSYFKHQCGLEFELILPLFSSPEKLDLTDDLINARRALRTARSVDVLSFFGF